MRRTPPSRHTVACCADRRPAYCRDFWSQIYTYMYTDGSGHPRIRYGTEVDSTKSQLGTATKLGISQVGYWTFNTLDDAMGKATVAWMGSGGG